MIETMETRMERKLIGAGRTSEVYEYGDDCILKLFTDEMNLLALKLPREPVSGFLGIRPHCE
jgi:hypothetical protein